MGGSHAYWIDGGLEVCMVAGCAFGPAGRGKQLASGVLMSGCVSMRKVTEGSASFSRRESQEI